MSDLTPYLCVADSRAAIDWYGEVFQATVKGKPYVMEDGRIGHVELIMGDALLMMADPFPEVDVEPPDASKGSTVSLHLEVPDCDAVAEAARPMETSRNERRDLRARPRRTTDIGSSTEMSNPKERELRVMGAS